MGFKHAHDIINFMMLILWEFQGTVTRYHGMG